METFVFLVFLFVVVPAIMMLCLMGLFLVIKKYDIGVPIFSMAAPIHVGMSMKKTEHFHLLSQFNRNENKEK